ncbi:MAG: hypothetical protein MUF65_02750 [Rubritepida sp.]|jgi:hypothetical protein|nr:hypothetical protein [Rubritepida sp.]
MRTEVSGSASPRDGLALALLLTGVALAVVGAILPVIQVNGRSGQVALSTWELLPWFTKLKFVALALLLAAAFLPRLARWRVPIAVLAVAMVFIPALSAFVSALYAWGTLRPELARLSGERQPFVHPGLANLVLIAAGLMVTAAVWRIERLLHPAPEGSGTAPAHA